MRVRVRRGAVVLLAAAVSAGVGLVATAPAGAVPGGSSRVFVNEIHYDNVSFDTGEAVEVAAPAGTDLASWQVVLYNGADGRPYSARYLTGPANDAGGGYVVTTLNYPQDGIQNGAPDGVALVSPAGTVAQFLSYEGTFTALSGPATGLTSTGIGVDEEPSPDAGRSLQLTGTGGTYADFTWRENVAQTFGAANAGQTFVTPPPPVAVSLSEIRADQPGEDVDEYAELAAAAGASLDGVTYLVIGDGSDDTGILGSGVVEAAVDLSGATVGSSGLFVLAESTFTLGTPDRTATLNFENADNVTHLLVRGFTGAEGADLDADDDGILDGTPWAAVLDSVALITPSLPPLGDLVYSTTLVGPDGDSSPGHVLRCDDGWRIGPFDPATGKDTPGAANACAEEPPPPPAERCGDPATRIHQIQGSGATFDPAYGGTRTVEGVVTAAHPGLDGFYLQEEPADVDADPATSEGIFVFLGADPTVTPGATVRVTGTVAEYTQGGSQQTQLTGGPTVLACDLPATAIAPTDVTFPLAGPGALEAVEGMLVALPQRLVISEYFNYDRFGEVVLALPPAGMDRLYTPTAVVDPGPEALALAEDYAKRRITLDDASAAQNPQTLPHPGNGQPFSLDNRFRGGDTVTGVQGVLDDTFGRYRVQPTTYGSYDAVNPRPASPPAVGGDVRVASLNVLNYFLTLDSGPDVCGPARDQECRGADTADELSRQRAKLLAALGGLDGDVVGLMELENTPDVDPAADLVAGLNEAAGVDAYARIDTGVIGTDAIRVGLLYQPAVVRPVGGFQVLDSTDDPRFDDTLNRPALAQTFEEVATGERFTVTVTHLKSKGSACGAGDDAADGSGNCDGTRTRAAEALVDWLAGDPTASSDPDQLVIGDLNAYDHERPVTTLTAAGYTDLVEKYEGELAYSYVFDGQAGYLDHALAGTSLAWQVTGTAVWHVNADEPDLLDYDMTFKPDAQDALWAPDAYRSSDHDPVLVGLNLATPTPEQCYAGGAQTVYSYEPGTRADGSPLPARSTDPQKALGTAEGGRLAGVSLGFGGQITLAFANPVHDLAGADLRIVDVDDGARGRGDAAAVYGSTDAVTWTLLGSVTGTGEVDLGSLATLSYVQVRDATPIGERTLRNADGYDVDAVEVLSGCAAG